MGWWGFHDDENDDTLDTWAAIEDKILPNTIINAYKDERITYENRYRFRETFVKNNPKLMYKAIQKWIKTGKKECCENKKSCIVGIILYAVKFYDGKKLTKFPKEFPKRLITEGLKSNTFLLKNISSAWGDNFKKRKNALEKQQDFFKKRNIIPGKVENRLVQIKKRKIKK